MKKSFKLSQSIQRFLIFCFIWGVGFVLIDRIVKREEKLKCQKVIYTYHPNKSKRVRHLEKKINKRCYKKRLFQISIKEDIISLIEKQSSIQSYQIIKEYPDCIQIYFHMREPYLYVSTRDGCYVYDKDAVPFKFYPISKGIVDLRKVKDGHVVMAKNVHALDSLGEKSSQSYIHMTIQIVNKMIKEEKFWQIKQVQILNDDSYSIILKNGITVFLGKHEVLKRVNKLKNLIRKKEEKIKSARTIDMRFGSIVIKK